MTANINIKFTVPSPMELKKAIRDNKQILNLERRLKDFDHIEWLEKKYQSHIDSNLKHENDLKSLKEEIVRLNKLSEQLRQKIIRAKEWMQKPTRNTDKDVACLSFQQNASEAINAIETVHIPEIERIIKVRNYDGAIKYNEKYIRNKPLQVVQRMNNDIADVLKKVESSVVDFHGVKGKEKHLLALKARLTKPQNIDPELLNKCVNNVSITLEQRIANIESAIAFRKLVDSRPNGQVLKKLAQEYFDNEQLEIDAICEEEWINYLNRVYFKGGMEAFYL